jgi:hypothetical protein
LPRPQIVPNPTNGGTKARKKDDGMHPDVINILYRHLFLLIEISSASPPAKKQRRDRQEMSSDFSLQEKYDNIDDSGEDVMEDGEFGELGEFDDEDMAVLSPLNKRKRVSLTKKQTRKGNNFTLSWVAEEATFIFLDVISEHQRKQELVTENGTFKKKVWLVLAAL